MKTIKQFLRTITFLLAFLILFQGCTVYKKQNSLEQAVVTKDKAKLITKENEKQKYLYITTINEEFYGTKEVNGKLTKILLQEENLKIIKTENKLSSALLSTLSIFGIPIAIGFILLIIYG